MWSRLTRTHANESKAKPKNRARIVLYGFDEAPEAMKENFIGRTSTRGNPLQIEFGVFF